MRLVPLLLLALGTFPAIAQEAPEPRAPRWWVGVHGSVYQAYRKLVEVEETPANNDIIEFYDDLDEPVMRGGFGLDVSYDLTPHWSVGSGVHYVDHGWRTEISGLFAFDPLQPDPAIPTGFRSDQHFRTLAFPLIVRYRLGDRLALIPGLGATADLRFEQQRTTTVTYMDGHTTESTQDLDDTTLDMGFSTYAELSGSLRIGERWEVRFGAVGRHGLHRISDTPVSARLFSFGIQGGVGIRF